MSIDALQTRIRKFKNPSMLGLDPTPELIPPHIIEAAYAQYGPPLKALGEAYRVFCTALLDELSDVVPAVKLQSACFEALGWEGGSLEPYAPGKSIGGGYSGNYEGLLPDANGRKWTECDINTRGKKSRGAERIVFSNDGLIYYTGDHYESFTLLYGEE